MAKRSAVATRAPQVRVFRNDSRILDAAVVVLATEGCEGMSFAAVARQASLSRRPVLERYQDVPDLTAAVWREVCGPELAKALGDVLSGAGLLDEEGSVQALSAALNALGKPNHALQAAAELVVMAQFGALLDQAVREVFEPEVAAWCTAVPRHVTRTLAGQRGYLLCIALGILTMSMRQGIGQAETGVVATAVLHSLEMPDRPSATLRNTHVHRADPTILDTGDPVLDTVLHATLNLIGAHGVRGTTTAAIARDAGCSEGLVFSRYASKQEICLDAIHRHLSARVRATHDLHQRVEDQYGPGMADAVTIRELQRPEARDFRALALEEERLFWHDPELSAAAASLLLVQAAEREVGHPDKSRARPPISVFGEYAVRTGARMLSVLFPAAWLLPYDVVTVPLAKEWRSHRHTHS
jgi:AcrR family transcriptional regulator